MVFYDKFYGTLATLQHSTMCEQYGRNNGRREKHHNGSVFHADIFNYDFGSGIVCRCCFYVVDFVVSSDEQTTFGLQSD